MGVFEQQASAVRRATGAVASTALMFASMHAGADAWAWDSNARGDPASADGVASVVKLRIPLQRTSNDDHTRLSLSLGPSWRSENHSPFVAPARHNTSSLEAGVAFGDAPYLRLGALDPLTTNAWRANADQSSAGGGSNAWVWWTIGGIALLAIVVATASTSEDCERGEETDDTITFLCPEYG